LLQNCYKSIVCQENLYQKELVRYIHLNPLRAGIVESLHQLENHPWSGHAAHAGKIDRPWQETRYVLPDFGDPAHSRKNYPAYVEKGVGQGRRPELTGGGLIRSPGGWSEGLACRKRGEKQLSNQRIPGDGDETCGESMASDVLDRRPGIGLFVHGCRKIYRCRQLLRDANRVGGENRVHRRHRQNPAFEWP
jgi:hypothetical protein